MKHSTTLLAALALLSGLTGCSTYTETNADAAHARRAGNVALAAQKAIELAEKHRADRDAIIFNLEAGAACRALALAKLPPPNPEAFTSTLGVDGVTAPDPFLVPYYDSIRYFGIADERIDHWEEQAKKSISAGAVMVVTNPATVPYRGQAYDKVMNSTYLALNYIALGETEKARASFNKAYRRQEDAVLDNQKRIERDQERIEAAKNGKVADENGKQAAQGVDFNRAQGDPKVQLTMDQIEAGLDDRIQAYGDYVNPFTVFMDAVFMLSCSTDQQEQERSAAQFRRVASMVQSNPYLLEDAALAEEIAAGRAALPKLTYVIFESGEAPFRKELIIPIPLFLATNEMLYTQLPLYTLNYNDTFNEKLQVTAGNQVLDTHTVCNMDSVIARDFKNGLPSMWVDAFLTASTKALIQHAVNKEMKKQGGTAALLTGLTLSLVNAATTRADTRSWQSLPKTFSYARVPTPEDGVITITTPDGKTKTITVPNSQVAIVYAKQVQPGTELLVDTFKL